jgi:hypothetical protein
VSGGAVLWAETPDEDAPETPQPEAEGHVDDSFAARRLRRWIRGMFGGGAAKRPVRDGGQGEEDRGDREAPPTDHPQP